VFADLLALPGIGLRGPVLLAPFFLIPDISVLFVIHDAPSPGAMLIERDDPAALAVRGA
jgi:hypothetical protein